MTDSNLILTECTDPTRWDAFVANSPQGSIFCRIVLLDALGVEYNFWFVEKNGQPLAGAVILRRGNIPLYAPYSYTMYQGILLAKHSNSLPPHGRAKWILEVTEALLNGLSEHYDRLSFCLHYAFGDLRCIQWFHYHEPHLGQFKFDLYYTGLLDLTTSSDFNTYLATIRQTRRYEYRKALREGLTVELSQDIDTLDHLHCLTFERQGLERSEEAERLLRTIAAAALAHGFGELLICRDRSGEVTSATLFLYDEQCGYYLFGANHPAYRSSNSGTFLMIENIRRCYVRGVKRVDMCGINSPNRGDFKTSFNALPAPYFVATWEKPQNG